MENLGLSHIDRYSEKLDASYFKIDERTLEDFISFSSNFAEYINYYNTENNIDGSAQSFIGSDITILLIHISSYDVKKIGKKLDSIIDKIEDNNLDFNVAFELIFDLIAQIDQWRNFTEELEDFNDEIIKLIISKFSRNLARIYEFENNLSSKTSYKPINRVFRFLSDKIWDISKYEIEPYVFKSSKKADIIHEAVNHIYRLFHSILSSLELLINSSQKYLQKSRNEGNTQPHIALYIAFVEMYKYAQNDINKFTQRHLDYYFKEILKFTHIPETPDKVHLVFDLQDNIEFYKLDKGTGFYAGQDVNGNDLQYKLNDEIVVTQAKINAIKTIINSNTHSDDAHELFEHVFLSNNINQDIHSEEKDDRSYSLGFAIASSFLKLSEGDREIEFTFHLQRYAFENFMKLYKEEILNDVNINIYDINEFVNHLFSFAYTSIGEKDEPEMFVIPKKNIRTYFHKNSYGDPLNQFNLTVTLPAVFPPIIPCLLDDFPEAKERELPVCYFFLSNEKLNFYNYYKQIIIDKVGIKVIVQGVRDLRVQNEYGSLDVSVPFEPFGATPSIGSTFYLGHETIFSKKIDDLQIVMDWKDVPLLENGFAEYYQGYSDIVNNQTFKVAVSALKDRKWIPADNKQVIYLFDDVDELEDASIMPVDNIRVIDDLDLNKINDPFKIAPKVNKNDAYSRISTNGFLKFEFIYPPIGFGHNEYPKIIKKQAFSSMKRGGASTDEINEPWSPTLNSISINYEASLLIDFNKQSKYKKSCYYHIQPFGNKLVSEPVGNKINFIPQYDVGTEVYIAIENFHEKSDLSIFINIDNLISSVKEKTDIKWSFLQNDTWIDIYDKTILVDSTNDLSTSGIIIFDFSEFDKEFFNQKNLTNNKIFPKGFFYLRIKTNSGHSFVNRMNYVKCHGAVASFFNNGNTSEHLAKGLPAETINAFTGDHPDIKQIIQPFHSFGGASEENRRDFQVRVSERLRHKNRGVTKWDFEHIVLQQFPDISKVICLNNTNKDVEVEPGNILVIVIPTIEQTKSVTSLEPRSSEVELKIIKDFIFQRISPFIKLEVRNPIYEHVQVKFEVQFREGYNPRYYLQIINQDLCEFLNPWVKEDSGIQVTASDNIYSIHIVYFLEKRPYVDFVSNVSVFHIINNSIINLKEAHSNNAVLRPTTSISIFVSSPEHIIDMIGNDSIQDAIGTLTVGKDFSAQYIAEKEIEKGIGKDEIEVDFEVEMKREITKEGDDYTLTLDI